MSDNTGLPDYLQIDITVDSDNRRAIDQLAAHSPFSKQKLKHIMQKGAVWLSDDNGTQRLRRAKKILQRGDILHLYYDAKVLEESPPPAQLIKDEVQYSIWYKPYGMRSQGSRWGDHTTIYRYAEQFLKPQRPAFIVHRLDRAASGLMIIAHSKTAAREFSRLFATREIDKHYRVIVHGKFPAETQHFNNPVDDKVASSFATLIKYDELKDCSLVEVKIETGRKHQIRRHLAEAGYPVVGDRLYGKAGNDTQDLQLTCCYLSFISPIDNSQKTYQLPEELLPAI
jgi:tRNA pseudouridine32 synthase/23S rRNA pseudouridine746 synthase